jgi:hypothetical protein
VFGAMSEGGQLLTWAIRHLMIATLARQPVPVSVLRVFDALGGARLSRALTSVLLLAARDADRPLNIHPPCCQELSFDEQGLIAALATAPRNAGPASRGDWRRLLDAEPSTALLREADAVGACFRLAGLPLDTLGSLDGLP